ncbi:hypothetical protein [Vibrio splendidus]|uniref:hypothetical protein n=1 Tax=Vibrio splendidus TaxID=29497 RepID=UPI000CBD836D|nr:hypothetical protein [Vibrio splendidus]PMH10891.1 hypothetical protein BCU77_07840 [Vibrio splendidus]
MKINFTMLAILALSTFSFQVHAKTFVDLTDSSNQNIAKNYPDFESLYSLSFEQSLKIDDYNFKFLSLFMLKSNNDNELPDVIYIAKISSSQDGQQRIYITLPTPCDENSDQNLKPTVVRTNGKNVRYSQYCDGSIYLSPYTDEGFNYLVKEFKQSHSVKFELSGIPVVFDAKGFTKAWNSFGGDAI